MTAREQQGFMASAALHAAVILLLWLWSFAASRDVKQPERIIELVAGDGNNFGATVAPALGTPGGKGAAATPRTPPTIAQQIQRNLWRAEAKGKQAAAKELAAEQKRLAQLEQEQQAKAKAETKAATQTPDTTRKAATPSTTRIDAEGIEKGVLGGSTENKIGGAGGKALVSSGGTVMERYYSMLKDKLLRALKEQGLTGLDPTRMAEVEFRLAADGTISGVRIIKRSGSAEFDAAVVAAFGHIEMPKRPDGKSTVAQLEFRTRDAEER
jgi:colicin import membrane protein